MGIKTKLIERFLIDEGFYDEKEIFDKEIEALKKEAMKPQEKSEDMYPSRARKPEGESNKKIGTGEASTTRKEQLVSKGKTNLTWSIRNGTHKFGGYPYEY